MRCPRPRFCLWMGLLLLGVLAGAPSARAETHTVDAFDPTCGGASPCYDRIQDAIDAAGAGDTVRIRAGYYDETLQIDRKNDGPSSETDRIVIEADPSAPVGSVVLSPPGKTCGARAGVEIERSSYVTVRGLTIVSGGSSGILVRGQRKDNEHIHLERNRILAQASSRCKNGIHVERNNAHTVIAHNLIYGGSQNGIRFSGTKGGPHLVVGNTIFGNRHNGVRVGKSHDLTLVNNVIFGNGSARGPLGGRYGVRRIGGEPEKITLIGNTICGNRRGEIEGDVLDAGDSQNLTPDGDEGPGVSAAPTCAKRANLFANAFGADELLETIDDDFTPVEGSVNLDSGVDPRTLGFDPALDPVFEVDYLGNPRPQDDDGTGGAAFTRGAIEGAAPAADPTVIPRTLYVNATDATCQGQSPCYTSIQAAVAAVTPRDTILVQPGTYVEQIDLTDLNNDPLAVEEDRIFLVADPVAPLGSVVIDGAVDVCPGGYAVRFTRSKYVTLQGFTITGAGAEAIELRSGSKSNHSIAILRNRIYGNAPSGECDGAIQVGANDVDDPDTLDNPNTVIANNLIYANGRHGVRLARFQGGPYVIVGNTIVANGYNGIIAGRSHIVAIANNVIVGNGTEPGTTSGRFGIRRKTSSEPDPEGVTLTHNLICGNVGGELNDPLLILDPTDSDNLTPTGSEGDGVIASPSCDSLELLFTDADGPDGSFGTGDDDFSLRPGSRAIDAGVDARLLGLPEAFDSALVADYVREAARPADGNGDALLAFDIGAHEVDAPPAEEAPTIAIDAPTEGALFADPVISVAGTVERSVDVEVNATTALVDNGVWSVDVTLLLEGENTLEATATNDFGATTVTRTVYLDTSAPVVTITSPADGTATSADAIAVSGTVTDASAVTSVLVNGVPATLVGIDFDETVPLALGVNTITVSATDELGHEGTASVIVIRGEAPSVTIDTPADQAVVGATPVTVAGSVTGTPPVQVLVNGTEATVIDDGYSVSIPLVEGANTTTAQAQSDFGSASTSIQVTLDTQPPLVAIASPADGSFIGTDTLTVTVEASDATSSIASVVVNGLPATPSGGSTFSVQVPLVVGSNTLTATATDAAGNAASAAIAVTRDVTPPGVQIAQPADGLVTSAATVTVSGTASDAAGVVSVDVNGTPATLTGDSYTAEVALVEGANVLQVSATDAAGNVGTAQVTVTRDTTAPVVAIVSPADGFLTAAASVTVSATTTDANAIASVEVNGVAATLVGSAYEAEVPLVEGANALVVTATDVAGNAGTAQVSVTRDSTGPTLTLDSPADGFVTLDASVDVSGTFADASAVVSVDVNGVVATLGTGTYQATVPLALGANTLTATATDAAGNASTAAVDVFRDTPIQLDVAILNLVDVGGVNAHYAIQNGFTTIRGTYSGDPGTVTVEVAYNSATQTLTGTGGSFDFLLQTTSETEVVVTVYDPAHPIQTREVRFQIRFDLFAPEITTVLDPTPDQLVPALARIEVSFTEVGLGVDPAASALTVNGGAQALSCSFSAADRLLCNLVVPATDEDMTWSFTATDLAGNTSAPATGHVILDSDSDGAPDASDAYPQDPDRQILDPVPGVSAQPNPADGGRSVALQWLLYTGSPEVQAYRVYRRVFGGSFSLLAELGSTQLAYVDATVANGTTYEYRVAGVGRGGVEGQPGTPQAVLVAYNDATVDGFSAARSPADPLLSWSASGGLPVRIRRSTAGNGETVVATVSGTSYTDADAEPEVAYFYDGASVRTFTNQATGASIEVEGPRSTAVQVPALPPFVLVRIDDASPTGAPNAFERERPAGQTLALAGDYEGAVGEVMASAVWGAQEVSSSSSNGRFALTLINDPAVTDDLVLTLRETLIPERAITASVRFSEDTTGPVLTIDGPPVVATQEDFHVVTGTAIDELSGVSSVSLTTDRLAGQSFAATLGDAGSFRAEVPVEPGPNVVTVTAVDGIGKQSQATVQVDRAIQSAPQIQITQPADGLETQANRVSVEGLVYSSLASEQLRLTLLDQVLFPSATGTEGEHAFAFADVPLARGLNIFQVRVESIAGNASADVRVTYLDPAAQTPPAEPPPPDLEITSPLFDTTVNGDTATITGRVRSDGGIETVTINGETVTFTCDPDPLGYCYFEYTIDLVDLQGPVTVVATDASGRTTERILSLLRDVTPPVLTLQNAFLPPPDVNVIQQQVVELTGTVSDVNLTQLRLGGQGVELTPAGADTYAFSVRVRLPLQQETPLALVAYDAAGNTAREDFTLLAQLSVDVQIVSPADGTEYAVAAGDPLEIDVLATLDGAGGSESVEIAFDDGTTFAATLQAGSVRARVPAPADPGEHSVTVTALASGAVAGVATHGYRVIDPDSIPLELLRHTPEASAVGVEPNAFVALFFNKPIDPGLLAVDVRETFTGLTYVFPEQGGADFFSQTGAQLEQVSRSSEPVPGGLAVLPGNAAVTFEPARDYAYGGDVFVDVQYDGARLGRFAFTVRALPTLAQGRVIDSFDTDVSGVSVTIPALGLESITDNDGNYSFGFGLSHAQNIPGGRYTLVVNGGLANPAFGEERVDVNLQQGRLTRLPTIKLASLNPKVPFVRIASGDNPALLAGGDLALDLTDTQLLFANGRRSGDVHVQFTTLAQMRVRSAVPLATPPWAFSIQPRGVQVTGSLGVQIQLPAREGGHAYLEGVGQYALLVGFDPVAQALVPVGVGEISGTTLTSVEPVSPACLDYLGVAYLPTDLQPLLLDYVTTPSSERSLDALTAELLKATGP